MLEVNPDKLIFRLLCLYAVLIPFETILDVLFGIDTVLKPYRVACLGIIGLYLFTTLLRGGFRSSSDLKEDILLYLIFIYGLFISFAKMIFTEFSMERFYNEIFQTSLYLAIFVIVKNLVLSEQQIRKLFQFLILGCTLNALYVFHKFYFLGELGRQEGFMDNPNYLSLSIIVTITFIIIELQRLKFWQKIGALTLLIVLFGSFLVAGSRTGLIVLTIIAILGFVFLSLQQKIITALLIGLSVSVLTVFSGEGLLTSESVLQSRLEDRSFSDDPRIPLWAGIIRASEETYFIGMGLGQFEAHFTDFYQGENNKVIYEMLNYGYYLSPHSDYFSILITYGVLGLILFLLFLFFSARKLLSRIYFLQLKERRSIYIVQFLGLVIIIIFGIAAENFVSALYWMIITLSTKSPDTKFDNEQYQ